MLRFKPSQVFRRTTLTTLRNYFHSKGIDLGLDWDTLDSSQWPEVQAAWEALDDATNATVAADFYDVLAMTSEIGIRSILEACRMFKNIDQTVALEQADHVLDFVMSVAVEQHDIWDTIVRFATADDLAYGRSWQRYDDLPAFVPRTDEQTCEQFRQALSAYYKQHEARGQFGVIEVDQREDGTCLFSVYLSDYPVAREVLTSQNALKREIDAGRVFTVYIRCPMNGGLADVSATGGNPVRNEILRIFGRCVPSVPVEFDLDNRRVGSYQLDHLRYQRTLPFDPTVVQDARIKEVRLRVLGGGKRSMTIKADPDKGPEDIYDVFAEWLNTRRIPIHNIDLQRVVFSVHLPRPAAGGRIPAFSFGVSRIGACNVGNLKDHYQQIGEQLLMDWGVDVSDEHPRAASA
jgi:hypothetical protein